MERRVLDQNEGEKLSNVDFGMEVVRYTRTSFERQILESVCIQQNTHHNLLNSRSEYNRCSLPRLSTKLGDKEFKKHEKQLYEEQKKEEGLEQRIREMRKTRCKTRRSRNQKANPPAKRRKTGEETYTRTCVIWETADLEQEEKQHKVCENGKAEKRRENLDNPAPKRQRLSQNDIRKFLMQPQTQTDQAEQMLQPADAVDQAEQMEQ